EDLSDEVAANSAGIGFVGFAYKRTSKPLAIDTGCGTVAVATEYFVKTNEYPLARQLYLYSPTQMSPLAERFVAFSRSTPAQDTVKHTGFIDFRPSLSEPDYLEERLRGASDALDRRVTEIRPKQRRDFESATSDARRLSITFRFQPGSD